MSLRTGLICRAATVQFELISSNGLTLYVSEERSSQIFFVSRSTSLSLPWPAQ